MLLLEDYHVSYPNGLKLDYGDIQVHTGELVGLFGESGCGKTSLLESLFSASFPGQVSCTRALLDGEPLPGPGSALYRKVSYCPQFSQTALNPKLSVKEHIRLTCKGNGLAEDQERIEEMLAGLRLEKTLLSRFPGQLSGGQLQRMVLLLCAIKRPKLLVLDEPSSAIDLITLRDIVTFLEEMKQNSAVLMVAHSRPLLERAADRIIEL